MSSVRCRRAVKVDQAIGTSPSRLSSPSPKMKVKVSRRGAKSLMAAPKSSRLVVRSGQYGM